MRNDRDISNFSTIQNSLTPHSGVQSHRGEIKN